MILNMSFSGGGGIAVDKISYTGGRIKSIITLNNKNYILYTFISGGTLTIKGEVKNADIWLCGGGADGNTSGRAGGGGYCAELDAQTLSGSYEIVVGMASEASSFGNLLSANGANGVNGGTGGGATRHSNVGTGDGVSKYPFGDTINFKCHCAGGGAGGADYTTYDGESYYWAGGNGGSNGSNGGESGYSNVRGGTGGDYGGGNGGNGSSSGMNASNGTYYGAGGGGAGQSGGYQGSYNWDHGSYGKGHQGVVYLRIPA